MTSANTKCLPGFEFNKAFMVACLGLVFCTQSIFAAEEATEAASVSSTQESPSPNAAEKKAIEKVQKILTEWEEEQKQKALLDTPTQKRFREVASEWDESETREFAEFAQRMIDVAKSKPDDVGARDALLWIISTRAMEPHPEVKQSAVSILLENHVNDPEVARAVLSIRNEFTESALLVEGLVSKSTDHESLGLAKLALAKFLNSKADSSEKIQSGKYPNLESLTRYFGEPYISTLQSMDVAATRERTEQLLEEVKTKYGDIPFVRTGRAGAVDLVRKKSLAQKSQYLLEEIRNLAIGKVAPEIAGVDMNGQPLSLSDHRGKVVVLVFWASWCGPCMAEIPFELALVDQFAGMPFTLLGVNCGVDIETAQKSIETEEISWPNWYDGFPTPIPGPGPIVEQYHVNSFPTVFVLDAKGIIRAKNLRAERLEEIVRELLDELESAEETNPETATTPSASPRR